MTFEEKIAKLKIRNDVPQSLYGAYLGMGNKPDKEGFTYVSPETQDLLAQYDNSGFHYFGPLAQNMEPMSQYELGLSPEQDKFMYAEGQGATSNNKDFRPRDYLNYHEGFHGQSLAPRFTGTGNKGYLPTVTARETMQGLGNQDQTTVGGTENWLLNYLPRQRDQERAAHQFALKRMTQDRRMGIK